MREGRSLILLPGRVLVPRSWLYPAAALLCAVYSVAVAFAMIKGMMLVMDVVPDVEMVRSGLDYSMHGMLAHNADDDGAPTKKKSQSRAPEKTEEMDGSGAGLP